MSHSCNGIAGAVLPTFFANLRRISPRKLVLTGRLLTLVRPKYYIDEVDHGRVCFDIFENMLSEIFSLFFVLYVA